MNYITSMLGGGSPKAGTQEEPVDPAIVDRDPPPQLSIHAADVSGEDVSVLVKVMPPPGERRTPSNIVCVIDVSGSMRTEVSIKTEGGVTESNGLTMLDIARHGIRTVLETMGDDDMLSVVWFNHQAGTLFGLTEMTEEGRKEASEKLDELTENGGTNIWLGLQQGLEELRTAEGRAPRLSHVMLLTDGQTSDRNSVLTNLKAYQQQYEKLPGTISTFGFGYNIDSPLLCELAIMGDATYSFIPDAGFVGTVFVNSMSNLLVTMAREVFLELEPRNGAVIQEVLGQCRMEDKADGAKRVHIGTLQYGQSRDICLQMNLPDLQGQPFVEANVAYEVLGRHRKVTEMVEGHTDPASVKQSALEVQYQVMRSRYVDEVAEAVVSVGTDYDSLHEGQEMIAELVKEIQESPAMHLEKDGVSPCAALLEDAAGQTTEALSKIEWVKQWGLHYLPSIMFAHKVQQCNNFKDPGVQVYGGDMFHDIQEQADELFNTIPAPQSRRPSTRFGGGGGGTAAPVSMAAYNDRYGACVDAACTVQLASGEMRRIGELAKGDVVTALDGATAEVVCLVRTACAGGRASLVELPGGCRLTPFHPVRKNGDWVFPVNLADAKELPCEAVCSVVLQGAPALVVDGVDVVALAHGLTEGVTEHAYFGTKAVLEDLAGAPGFEQGLVELSVGNVVRDAASGLVSGFRF